MTNKTPELNRFLRRSLICAAGVLFFFFILLLRLIYLQVFKHDFYDTLSDRNVINIVPIPANRGLIYDRNGVLLAKNVPVYSLMIVPGRVRNLKDTIKALQKIVKLSPDEVDAFYRNVKQAYPSQPVSLKQQLSESEAAQFYVNQYRFPGVSVQANMMREYPLGEATANVVGYISRITASELAQVNPANYTATDMMGKAGVELEDESLLHGTMGAEEAEIDANGKIIRILKKTPAISGSNIYLTIDSKLQAYGQKLLGKNNGAIVAIQPNTGQVLALVTNPSYDPNLFTKGMTQAEYHELITNPNHPLFNRTLRATYAPGSTVKPFIAYSALNDGVITAKDNIFDPGWYQIPNTKHIFHNWMKNGFGWVNVTKSITVSCDTFFYQLAVALGIDRLDQALTQFGFGQLTGINLPGERAGIVPTPAWKQKHIGQAWYTGDTVVAGIGQGYVTATPLQLAYAATAIANRGLKFQPSVLLKLQQPDGETTVMQPISEKPVETKDPKNWDTVIQGMQQVVSDPQGTAHATFSGATYTAAGKTGTAQVHGGDDGANPNESKRLQNNHLFIVFAPVDHPQIVVAVVVEHIHGMSQLAVQVARQFIDYYFTQLKVEQAKEAAEIAKQPAIPAPQGLPVQNKNESQPALPQPNNNEQKKKDNNIIPAPNDITPAQPSVPAPKTTTPSIPAPQKQIQQDLTSDLQNEIQHKNKNNKVDDDTALQNQMDEKMDAQMEIPSEQQ